MVKQTGATTATMRRERARGARGAAFVVSAVAMSVGLLAAPAAAVRSGSVALGASTVAPGASTSVTGSFSNTAPGITGGTFVSFIVTPGAGAVGSVSLVGPGGACVDVSATQVDCLWTPSGSTGTSFVVTATAAAGSSGSFTIATSVTGDDPDTPADQSIVTTDIGSATLTVQAPATTTTTAVTTPTTAVAGSNGLPSVGTRSGVFWPALSFLLAGAGLVAVSRRRVLRRQG